MHARVALYVNVPIISTNLDINDLPQMITFHEKVLNLHSATLWNDNHYICVIHNLRSFEIKAYKNSGLNGIQMNVKILKILLLKPSEFMLPTMVLYE